MGSDIELGFNRLSACFRVGTHVTLVSVVADDQTVNSSDSIFQTVSLGIPPLRLLEALFFRSSLWPWLWTAYQSEFQSIRTSTKLPPLRKGKGFRAPTLRKGKAWKLPPLRKGNASDLRRVKICFLVIPRIS